jgi:thiaminase (transcriptional activator TenA)
MTQVPAPRATAAQVRPGWTGRLWAEIEPIYDAILDHPFIKGLTSGELDVNSFVQFISQDTHYLQDYVRTLLTLAAKSPDFEVTKMLTTHAAAAATAETGLHAELMTDLGRDPAELLAFDVRPTTRAYTTFLVATVFSGSFADGLAAVMPCFWIYAEVGKQLKKAGSPNPVYQRWIDSYGSDDYLHEVNLALDLTDRVGLGLGAEAEAAARQHFRTASRYEWMFWDAAHRQEAWPV